MTDARASAPASARDEDRLRRLKIRGWRRGMKEMDLIFGPFADALLAGTVRTDLDALEALMEENDQDLYLWISGAQAGPAAHAPAIAAVRTFHGLAPSPVGGS